ncbi:MAG: hypothetical protein P8183_24275, partial [Anaerolineae bacterium]
MLSQTDTKAAKQAIEQMDHRELGVIVSRALAEPVTVTDWQAALLGGLDSSPMAGGVYAVTGTACAEPAEVAVSPNDIHCTWRIIVKRLCSPAGFVMPDGTPISREMAEDQAHFGYWKREALVAQSGLLDDLPDGLAAPRCLGLTEISRDEVWLWQEAAVDDQEWNWNDYRKAAYRLGLWQGRFVVEGRKRPSPSWLSQNWLSRWVNGPLTAIFGMFESADGWRHPLISAHFAPEEIARLQQLWADRNNLL